MHDIYPLLDTLPAEWLVPPEEQPDYLEVLETPGPNLGEALSDAHVRDGRGDDIAIIHHESSRSITYRELAELSTQAARALRTLGIRPGERVALRGGNRPELLIAALGVWKLGAVVVPVPVLSRASELAFYLEDTEPAAIIVEAGAPDLDMVLEETTRAGVRHVIGLDNRGSESRVLDWEALLGTSGDEPLPPVDPDTVAIVWHTGGTTGRPKGCYHTQRRFLLAGGALGLARETAPGQRWMAAAPIGHALGMIYHTNFTLLHGAAVVMVEKFTDAGQLLEAMRTHKVTTFTAITATWIAMMNAIEAGTADGPPGSLVNGFAMWQSSSSSDVFDWWKERGITLLNNFGSTAFATWVLVPGLGLETPRGSLGDAAPGYEVRTLVPGSANGAPAATAGNDVGQMAVRGVSGLTYWRLSEKQREDVREGWVIVDDLIQRDGNGYAYLGRTDFMISSNGNKISPGEVENVLSTHPSVREVVVIGLPDPVRQEIVSAFVVVKDGVSPSDDLRAELQNKVKQTLSPYKYPRRLEFIDALPRDHVGKVQPKVMRERALATMVEETA
ncbi:class I adenylate-forming enzyme family protein [Arthrobacter sp. NPDC080031]|uniref:acyl-CoA synthetase n=1 Tax=Arthrobacter sp. NPDC080031 TaxID=3155918 RepID=UPI003450D02C